MPLLVGLGVVAVIGVGLLLFSTPAAADGAEHKIDVELHKPAEMKSNPVTPPVIVVPDVPAISLLPTPGMLYRIVEGDTGSALCVKAYGSERPTARWLHVAADPRNAVRLSRKWADWFLPKWQKADAPVYSTWTGTGTGHYAVVYFPKASEVAL